MERVLKGTYLTESTEDLYVQYSDEIAREINEQLTKEICESLKNNPEYMIESKVADKHFVKTLKKNNIDLNQFVRDAWPEDYI